MITVGLGATMRMCKANVCLRRWEAGGADSMGLGGGDSVFGKPALVCGSSQAVLTRLRDARRRPRRSGRCGTASGMRTDEGRRRRGSTRAQSKSDGGVASN